MSANRISLYSLLFLTLLTISPRMFAQVAFDRSDLNAGTAPVSSVAYDFNRDGHVDLAVVNSGSNTVSIFLGNGNGTFTLASEAVTGANPSALRVGDFNRDGLADLAVLNRGDKTISILLGNGDGSFRSGGRVALAGNSLVVKDFNRDGTDDLATVSGNTISVVLGNGDGTFASPSSYSGGPFSDSSSLTSGDFNGDGVPDLAVENCCDPDIYVARVGRIAVLLGNGDGTFRAPALMSASGPISLESADINNDGFDDLVNSYAGCHTPCVGLWLMLSNGDGTFHNGPEIPYNHTAYGWPGSLAFGDFDNNGKLDITTILSYSYYNQSIGVFLQRTDGSAFQQVITFRVGNGPSSITVADFNGDGRPDLAVTNRDSNTVSILLNADHAVVFLSQSGDYPLDYPVWFPNQQVGTTSTPRTVTLTNTGNIPLLISDITVVGDYLQTNDCDASVGPGSSCTFNILFTPTVIGQRDGTITIADKATNSPQIIRLTGNGT